jgi:hypothetical protein
MINEVKYPTGRVLGEGDALIPFLNGYVGVRDGGGREQYERAGRELDDELQIPKDQMPALLGVKISERLHCAQTEWQVADIAMPVGPYAAPKIEGRARKHGLGEGAVKVREAESEFAVVLEVVVV